MEAEAPKSKSSHGLQTVVVDSNALIQGLDIFSGLQYELCTIKEVVSEIRDEKARQRISALPVPLALKEPSPESISIVVEFARATGDLHVLSETDIKVIALARTLEVEAHGDAHLRTKPPPLLYNTNNRNKERDPPGWGSNVPNLEEWDAIPDEDEENVESHILGIKNLSLNGSADGTSEVASVNNEQEVKVAEPKKSSKTQVDILEKKNVFAGVNASKDEGDDEGEWEQACSRTIRRKRKKRAARLAAAEASKPEQEVPTEVVDKEGENDADQVEEVAGEEEGSVQEELPEVEEEEDDEEVEVEVDGGEESEQSWTSTIACLTTDFAMQNVILQMRLRLFTPTGLQVRQLHRWVLRCHACANVTRDVERLFCPKCGNGGTLTRVSMTVGADGSVQLGTSRRRISIRGTRYSLPKPKGGRRSLTANPILREDQLPARLLHPKTKKKGPATIELDTITSFDDLLQPKDNKIRYHQLNRAEIARQLTGRRNPNDLHFQRKR